MVASTVVTSGVLAKNGAAADRIPQHARDHMSDQEKTSSGILHDCSGPEVDECPDTNGGGDNDEETGGSGVCSGDDTPEESEEDQCP